MSHKEPNHFSMQYLQYFEFDHLPAKLQVISKKFHDLAWDVASDDDLDGPMVTHSLHSLLDAKDAAVRAAL